jgi:hypothetical protein
LSRTGELLLGAEADVCGICRTSDADVMCAAGLDPGGCAYGFQALTHSADVSYQIDRVYDPSEYVSIAFVDPELVIPWPLPITVRSQRGRQAPPLAAATRLLT